MSDQLLSVDILPTEDDTFSLGSASKPWNLYAGTINGVAPEEMGGGGDGLPEVTSSDNGKIITVANGDYAKQKYNATLISKTISDNGTYRASDDNADGYSMIIVNAGGSLEPGRTPRTLGSASFSFDDVEFESYADGELVTTE